MSNPSLSKPVVKTTAVIKNNKQSNSNNTDKYEQLEKLAKLKENNIITEEEFEREKKKILD